MRWITNIWTARAFVIAGFLFGWNSLGATVGHMGNELFLLVPDSPNGQAHSWHHFFRELGGDFGAMAAILVILFAPRRYRNPLTWSVMLILMIGFYAPFWVGVPFMPELGAPSLAAEINHLLMAVPALIGCFLAWPSFRAELG
jgi:hypothetical protein